MSGIKVERVKPDDVNPIMHLIDDFSRAPIPEAVAACASSAVTEDISLPTVVAVSAENSGSSTSVDLKSLILTKKLAFEVEGASAQMTRTMNLRPERTRISRHAIRNSIHPYNKKSSVRRREKTAHTNETNLS